MRNTVPLDVIRNVIRQRKRVKFTYERKTPVVADIYLLGNAWRSDAYIVLAWCTEPGWGWKLLRYAEIRNFETVGTIDCVREDFDPVRKQIVSIDTMMMPRGVPARSGMPARA